MPVLKVCKLTRKQIIMGAKRALREGRKPMDKYEPVQKVSFSWFCEMMHYLNQIASQKE